VMFKLSSVFGSHLVLDGPLSLSLVIFVGGKLVVPIPTACSYAQMTICAWSDQAIPKLADPRRRRSW
jgi:hypothetical protein